MLARQSDRRVDMSKFKIGDRVFLSPESRWATGNSLDTSSANPLNVEGVIDHYEYSQYSIMWNNGRHNSCYTDDDLIPSVAKQPTQECPHSIIEELECNIESLEELISEQAREIEALTAAICWLRK